MKITKYILSLAAAIGLAAGCQKAEMVQMLPMDEAVAPVLSKLPEKIVITPLNMTTDSVVFNWTSADFGVKTQISYSIEVAEKGGTVKAIVSSGITDTTAVLYYETINSALYESLELLDATATDVEFSVSAYTGESAKVYSNAVPVNATCTAAEKQYPKIWVVGDYCGWDHGKSQYLFDFAGKDEVYQGVIDFGEAAANGWKITGVGKWDDSCNWGGDENETYEAEAATTQLINGGGSKDLKHYSKRFYHFALNKGTLLLTKNFSFDKIGVIGVNGDWDNDVEMSFHVAKQRFYADIELTADGNFKFRADGGWDLNWGVKDGVVTAGGDNIEAKAGKYRVYLNLNNPENITYELNAKAYGIVEGEAVPDTPAEPETPTLTGWGIVGTLTEWADGADIMLANDGTWYVAKGVEFGDADEFKIRQDGKWDVSFGGEFAADAEVALTSENAPNIKPAKGKYDIYFNPETGKAWFITDGTYPGGGAAPELSAWSLIGDFNSWGGDYAMFIEGDFHVAKGFKVEADGKVKFRKDAQWNYKGEDGNDVQTNLGGAAFAVDAELPLTAGGADLIVTAGTYDVYLKVSTDENGAFVGTAYFMTDGKTPEGAGAAPEPEPTPDPAELTWYLVGNFNGWNPADPTYTMTAEGDYFVFKNFAAPATVATENGDEACQLKFAPGEWSGDKGGVFAVNTACPTGSDNIHVPEGTYDIYLSKDVSTFYFMTDGKTPADAGTAPENPGENPGENPETPVDPETPFEPVASEWGIVGDINGWNAPDITMYTTPTEGLFVARSVEMPAGGFKIRANGTWNDEANYGVETAGSVAVDHVYNVITSAGSGNMTLDAGTYDIWFNLKAQKVYIMTPGKDISEAVAGTPVVPLTDTWYLVGNFNGWKPADPTYKMTSEGSWYVFKNFKADGKGMKFVGDANWTNERVGNFESANKAISVAKGMGDMFPTAGTYDVYLSSDAKTAYFMTPGTTPAN